MGRSLQAAYGRMKRRKAAARMRVRGLERQLAKVTAERDEAHEALDFVGPLLAVTLTLNSLDNNAAYDKWREMPGTKAAVKAAEAKEEKPTEER